MDVLSTGKMAVYSYENLKGMHPVVLVQFYYFYTVKTQQLSSYIFRDYMFRVRGASGRVSSRCTEWGVGGFKHK
jgi:hypothetical protein